MNTIEALLEERRGYVARGLRDRVAQVDKALDALGYRVDSTPRREAAVVEPESERAVVAKPRGRKA